jgi:hypothetical protein
VNSGGLDCCAEVSTNWAAVPADFNGTVIISIWSNRGDFEQLHLLASNKRSPRNFTGFVEGDGHVSMYAVHFASPNKASNAQPGMPHPPVG